METRMLLLPPPQEANYQFNPRPGPRVPLSHFSKKLPEEEERRNALLYSNQAFADCLLVIIIMYCGLLRSHVCFPH